MRRFLFGFILLFVSPGLLNAQQGKVFSVFDKGVSVDIELTTITVTGAAIFNGTVTMNAAVTINNTVAVNDVITATVSDAATTTVTDVLKLIHNTSGTPDAGLGTGLQFQVEDLGGDEEQASIDVVMVTVTDGAEDVDAIHKVNSGGAMIEGLRVVGAAGEVYVVVGGKESGQALQALTVESQGPSTTTIGVSQDTSQNLLVMLGSSSGNAGQLQLRTHQNVTDISLKSGSDDSYINSGNLGLGTTTPTNKFEIVLDSDGEVGDSTVLANSAGQWVLPSIGNNPTRPSLAFNSASPNTGFYESAADQINVVIAGQAAGTYNFSTTSFRAVLTGGPELMEEAATATNPTLNPYGGVFTTGIGGDASGNLSVITNSASRIYTAVGGNVGIGTVTPDRLLHAESSTALTNAVSVLFRISHITSGTPAAGIGLSLEFEQETTVGNNEVGVVIEAAVLDTTGGSEDFKFTIDVMEDGSLTEALVVDTDADILIGGATSPTNNDGNVLVFAEKSSDPTMDTNTAGVYGKLVTATTEIFVVDEADNASQISPHDPETGKWIFYSKNTRTGRVLRVEMEELIFDIAKEMSKKTGKTYIYESQFLEKEN